ncbi:TPM domain-containing protein [Verrucomicrobiota bacterium sgz303538]
MNTDRACSARRGQTGFWVVLLIVCCLCVTAAFAAENLPPAPPRYFNDFAGLVSKQTADSLNTRLEQFERESSNQIVVAIYPKLPPDAALEDYTQRTAEAWRVGQKKLNNGAVLFIFAQDRKMRIEVGYGLEGVLPDIAAKQIIENEIKPAFRAGNYDAGVTAAVDSLIKATRGEYKGTGRTASDRRGGPAAAPGIGGLLCPLLAFFFIFLFIRGLFGARRGTMYGPRGRRRLGGPPMIFWGGGGWGGGGGGGWSGGGGGFSGGGGSFGGGGASGDW